MSTAVAGFNARNLLNNSDVLLAVAVISIIGMMIIPLPTFLLDILLALNIALAVMVVMVALYMKEPLEFSSFPSLLLILTLFRLGLNISTTRLIMLQADAGEVVRAFGGFVVGGNYIVGIVVFLILMIIQFIVITNGAGRVAEVAARFTLDAMPGKQMSIDADMNAGLITETEARTRRKQIQQEADFYGAMDGASKFVKGDAVAGIIITLINIFGGFAIGMFQLGIPMADALQTYTLLTVGDGLVSQIPALLISTATGIIVTRAASDNNMGNDVVSQLTGNVRAIAIVAALLIGFALIPGLPKIPFIVMSTAMGAAVYYMRKDRKEQEAAAQSVAAEATPKEVDENEVINDLLQVDTLEVEIGYGLISLVDSSTNSGLLDRIVSIRRQIAAELGFVLPKIRIRDNLQLPPTTYSVKLRGQEIARGTLMPGRVMAMAAGPVVEELPGTPTNEPVFGLPALWIDPSLQERAETLGYTVVDPASIITTHLTEMVKAHAPEILTRQATRELLDILRNDSPALVDDLVPGMLSLAEVQEVLRNLLAERVSIRDLATILETVGGLASSTRDPDLLSEGARRALMRAISNQYRGTDGVIHALTLSPRVEKMLADALGDFSQGIVLHLDPQSAQQLLEATAARMEILASEGHLPVVLCSANVRLAFKRLTERALPNLAVLSYSEIAPGIDVQAAGIIEIGSR